MTTKRPLSYLGVDSPNPPKVSIVGRAPTAADYNGYVIGDIWINTAANTSYILVSKSGGTSTWSIASPGASDVDTINSLSPVAGDIVIAGGTNLTDTNAGNTVTLDLDDAIVLATSVTSPLYTSAAADLAITAPAGQDVLIQMGDNAGANKVSFLDSDSAEVFAIDSNGTLGTFAGLTVTGIFTQTAGAVNIGQNNAADAINIGGGNVARAIAVGSTGAHTVAVGSAAAGAITVDTAAGISLDGATASNFTVTGAAQDLTLRSTGGSVNVVATQAAADAVRINASDAAGGIDVDCGTNGLAIDTTGAMSLDAAAASNFSVAGAGIDLTLASAAGRVIMNGEEAAANALTLLSAAGGLDTDVALQMNLDSSQAAATAVRIVASNAAGGIDIDSGTGGIAIDSTGTLSLDSAGATNFTATGAFDITVNSTAGSVILTGAEAAADAVRINASDAAGGIDADAGTGGINVATTGTMVLDSAGVLELNSSAGAIGIGNDAVAQNINVGTGAAARTITVGNATGATSVVVNSGTGAASFGANATAHITTVGSTTGASALVLQSGTGEITVTGTVKEITSEFTTRSGDYITFQSDPLCMLADGTYGEPTGATGEVDYLMFQEGIQMEQFILGAGQTILAPTIDANGLLSSLDLTATEGVEYNFGAVRNNSRHAFTIGTSPSFFFELRFRINDMDGADPYIFGFRKVEANNATWETYTDYAAIGMNAVTSATEIVIVDELNSGGTTLTNTTDLWGGDGTINTLRVLVSGAGVVTYTINGVAPSVGHAFTFDNADVVVPFIRLEHSASPTAVNFVWMKIGYQA